MIYRKTVPENEIKPNLIAFLGFPMQQFDDNLNYITKNFDVDELIGICSLLQIKPTKILFEDGKAIINGLTIPPTPKSTNLERSSSHSSSSSTTSTATVINPMKQTSTNSELEKIQTSTLTIEEQSIKIHTMKNKLIDLEEEQLEYEENSKEFISLGKKILILSKRVSLEENRRLELLEERRFQLPSNNFVNNSNPNNENQDFHAILLKTPQNLKLSNFDGSSCLDFHYFMLQYESSSKKYKLSVEENLIRLNEHLKGEARLKVDLLLKSSKDPSAIIKILNTHYGGDDRVLKEIIKKSHEIKKVTTLEQFKEFNCTLQNITSVISEMNETLFDVQRLFSIFLEKLPDHFVTQWANYLISKDIT